MREHVAVLVQMAADHHVFQRGHAKEHLQVLERARQPARRQHMRRQIGDVLSEQHDLAARRLIKPRDHVEQRGLAGAVRSDDGENLARIDRERHVIDGADAAEIDAETLRRQHAHDGLRRNRLAMLGTMPARRKIMNTIMISAERDVLVVVEHGQHLRKDR